MPLNFKGLGVLKVKRLFTTAIILLILNISGVFGNSDFSDREYHEHIKNIKVYDKNQTVTLSKPFVIITNITSKSIKQDNIDMVQFAIKTLKKLFFTKNPNSIIDIWIFKDRESFINFNHRELNSTSRDDVAGYYMKDKNMLVLDIQTGIGTIIHEMVHAFMDSNFPQAPSWFDEGLASLYEGTISNGEYLIGDLNWRLPILKATIRANRLISFKELMDYNVSEFYSEDRVSINYAHARYLLYYLQNRDLLVDYYREFSTNFKDDPTGYKSLKKILKVEDMDKFTKEWKEYILKLEDWEHYLKRIIQ